MIRFEPTLIVERMRIARDAHTAYDERFHDGVNVISGENSSGKSTVLNFLFYGLGGDLFDWSAVAKLCSKVYLQVRINGNIATLAREISTTPRRSMDIFAGELDEALGAGTEEWARFPYVRSESKESFSQVLFRLLNVPEVANETSGNLTMNQMLRLLYSDQLTPVESLFKYQGAFDDANIRDAVGRLLFGAHSSEFYNNHGEIRNLRKEYDELTGEYRSLVSAAGEVSEGFTHEWVGEQRRKLLDQLSAVEAQIAEQEKLVAEGGMGKISLEEMGRAHERVLSLQEKITDIKTQRDSLSVRIAEAMRWSRLLGQVGGEVKLIPDVIMPPVWSSDHGGHAPHDLKHRSVHRPLPGFAPLDPSAVAACCSR